MLAVPLGFAIGVVVGAVGGGGAILALPVLVYVLGESVTAASTASLVVVALAATVGGASLARDDAVCWRLVAAFSAAAVGGTVIGAIGNRAASGALLLLAFVPVMLLAGYAMWRRAGACAAADRSACPPLRPARVGLAGFGVGMLTGFFGVGGGFVIVPVLTLWLGLGTRRAIGSSLAIIALTALTALGSHLLAGGELDLAPTATLAATAAAGALAGTALGRRLPTAALGRGFALVVAAVALLLLVDVLALGGPPSG